MAAQLAGEANVYGIFCVNR